MNTIPSRSVCRPVFILPGILVALSPLVTATISEPDNLIYGSISLDGSPVTASRNDVWVEARRSSDGPAVASYRMGKDPALGNFYSLTIALESGAGAVSQDASTTGQNLYIVVSDGSGARDEIAFSVDARGTATRIDFGTTVKDVDGNGLPDLWEVAHFGSSGQNPAAVNRNGQTTIENFLAGTDPNDATDRFQVHADLENNVRVVSFLARAAEGPGYAGLKRYYTLETSPDLTWNSWGEVNGFVQIKGANQPVIYQSAVTTTPAFFRGRVRLVEE